MYVSCLNGEDMFKQKMQADRVKWMVPWQTLIYATKTHRTRRYNYVTCIVRLSVFI